MDGPKNETTSSRAERYKAEIERLQGQTREMESELRSLHRSRLQLDQALQQNEKLTHALADAREKIEILRKEVEKLTAPPSSYATFYSANKDGSANILLSGRKMKVNLHPHLAIENIKIGQEIVLNEALNIVEVKDYEPQGEVVHLKDTLDDNRLVVTLRTDEERVVERSDLMKKKNLSFGDCLLMDAKSGFILEKLPKSEAEELVLEEVPDIDYSDIGGLAEQIEIIKDAVELPSLYPELHKEYQLRPAKGILLYGPPGCGKTLIAKALANSMAKSLASRSGKHGKEARSYFLHIKGPELLNKYVGESEKKIREVFQKAREKAGPTTPVIVFFDEMDALFRTRGSGISSDVESTIVPQFLSEIDGVETLSNVIVIGASNRQDLIDPAILRSGRLDIRIKIDRPDKEGARDILTKYFHSDLPLSDKELSKNSGDRKKTVGRIIDSVIDKMFEETDENQFLEVTYVSSEKEILYFKDFISGAMLEGIVRRAKKCAVKRFIATKERGMQEEDFHFAIDEEFRENEDLPNTTNPDDWAKISGRKGEKIINVRTLGKDITRSRKIDTIGPGHYL